MEKENDFSFEKAYSRLEKILEELNSGETPLEYSLDLYEEADQLIRQCTQKLHRAEQKIQILMKTRDGSLALNAKGEPRVAEFLSAKDENPLPSTPQNNFK